MLTHMTSNPDQRAQPQGEGISWALQQARPSSPVPPEARKKELVEIKHASGDARQGTCSTAEQSLEAACTKATIGTQYSFGLQPPHSAEG